MSSSLPGTVLPRWIPLTTSIGFLLKHVRILGWSLLLVAATGMLTWFGYIGALDFITGLTGHFFQQAPEATGLWGWFVVKGWLLLKYFSFIVIRIIAFYLAFLVAYCLTTPGYVFLSTATEKIYLGRAFTSDDGFTLSGMITDLVEGCKIGAFGVLVTMAALVANFIPVVGPIVVLLMYTFYSALMFVDYPSSRYHWSLGRKIGWVRDYYKRSFRLGIVPALISMVPFVNIFVMALLFPLFTVHTTLNFIAVEQRRK
ncbi:MAG: cysteine biosynthesis protein [Desulfocapsa sp.]|nr:MAG: cysteine biosynthesis protein [Desulfocapsa sp.]